MSLVRWAPFSAFNSVERQMRSMLDQFPGRTWLEGFDWKPDTDVYREDGSLFIRAELAGIDPEDVTIDVEGSVLHIKGEKRLERDVHEDDRFLRERRFGFFHRDLMLPEGVDPDKIVATFDNGVLTVEMPLPESVDEPGKVPIEIKTIEPASV